MAAVSVLEDFTADRCLDDILHSMFNIEDKLQDSQFISPTAVSCTVTFILKKYVLIEIYYFKFNFA